MRFDRRTKAALVALGIILAVATPAALVGAEVFLSSFFGTTSNVHLNATDGPEVITTKNYNLQSGNPFTTKSVNLSTQSNGWLNVSTSDPDTSTMEVTVEEINGTETHVSGVSAPAGSNITLQPSDKNFTAVSGEINTFKFRDIKVDDGATDFTYTASGGAATVVVETNATEGTQYGLIDTDTNEGLDVATADADGTIDFTGVPTQTSETSVRIEQLGTLTIRDVVSPHPVITSATAEVTFFEDVDDDPTIVRRTTNDGTIDLTGLPVDEQFSVQIQAPNHHNRTVLIDDLSQQENVFLINTSNTTVENRFLIEDRTGDFQPSSSELVVQKAINRSEFGGSPAGFEWVNVAGDDLGADDAFVTDLIEDDRYRLRIQNDDGDTRILGAYTAETTGTITLTIGNVVLDPTETPQPAYTINITNTDPGSGQTQIQVEYNDSESNTDTIWLEIYEFNNESNVLLANSSTAGPFGTFTHTETVPDAQNDTTWVVELTAERSPEENVHVRKVVGPTQPILTALPGWLVSFIFVGAIWMTAGLFSQLNGDIGAIVVAGMGAIFFYLDLVPSQLGAAVVTLALITAGIMFIRERQSGGL